MMDIYKQNNIEFNITFCETNIRWLCGDLSSEERDRKIAFNFAEVARLKNKLKDEWSK